EGLEDLVYDAEREGADQRPPEIADPAEDDDHEGIDDVALAEIGADIVDLRQRDATDAGNPRTEAEGERVDAGRADAHGARHFAVLRDGAHLQAERRAAEDDDQRGEDAKREDDDPQPPIADREVAEVERARHPG